MKNLIQIAGLLTAVLFTLFYSLPTLAGRMENVPAIEVQQLGNFRGQFVTLYYGFEKANVIRPDKDLISLSEVRSTATMEITADAMLFQAIEIPKTGVRGAYDTIVLTVSPYRNFVLKNADGTIPDGLTDTKVHQLSAVGYRKISDIDLHIQTYGAETYKWVRP